MKIDNDLRELARTACNKGMVMDDAAVPGASQSRLAPIMPDQRYAPPVGPFTLT